MQDTQEKCPRTLSSPSQHHQNRNDAAHSNEEGAAVSKEKQMSKLLFQSVPASEPARPEIDYTLSEQLKNSLHSALQCRREYLEDIRQLLRLKSTSSLTRNWTIEAIDHEIEECRELQEKFLRGFETVIRDIQ